MTDAERSIILHSLGLTPRGSGRLRRWSYRNYFCASMPHNLCDGLCAAGFMRASIVINHGANRLYHVTDAGAAAAGVLERFRREDRLP